MGIRPSLSVICGLHDLKVEDYHITDPRWNGFNWWEEETIPLPADVEHLIGNEPHSYWLMEHVINARRTPFSILVGSNLLETP